MILPVVKYGDPVLTTKAEIIDEITDEIRELAENMFETMYAADGVGLAAQQVGELKMIAVVDPSAGEDPEARVVLINPEIIEESEECEPFQEGCLSFPEIRFDVVRPKAITVKAQNLEGEEVVYKDDEFLARIMQHEIDHLHGVVFIDYLKGMAKQMVKTRIKSMKRKGEWD
jgi:peptide deformylase